MPREQKDFFHHAGIREKFTEIFVKNLQNSVASFNALEQQRCQSLAR